MTSLTITESSIPDLSGKTALVTGGSSGIGLGAVQVLLDHHARVFILDIQPPPSDISPQATYIYTDVSSWDSLVDAFATITCTHKCGVDIAIANAGIIEMDGKYLGESLTPAPTDSAGWNALKEVEVAKANRHVDVLLKGTMNTIILAAKVMKRQEEGGSIVITSSATAFLPEQVMPVYSACKAAHVNLIRALRPTLPLHNISINGVAPSGCDTPMLPTEVTGAMTQLGIPMSTSRHVGLALVYSATATQSKRVEDYAKDQPVPEGYVGKWNGRIIHTIGDQYFEVEEKYAEKKGLWWGEENLVAAKKQQVITDSREI